MQDLDSIKFAFAKVTKKTAFFTLSGKEKCFKVIPFGLQMLLYSTLQ